MAKSNVNDDLLVFAHVLFRHGERNILHPYGTDPYSDEIHWPGGFGQLTNEGKRQLHRFGQYLRRRYGEIISPKYSAKEIYIQSTDIDRTIMSAQACLSGLYPPTDDEKWNDELHWHPIPVHTIPIRQDYILLGCKYTQAYDDAIKNFYENSPEIQQVYSEHGKLFEEWSRKSGSVIKTIEDVIHLYHTILVEKEHNKRLSEWALEAIQPNGIMENIAKLHIKSAAETPELARLKSGDFIKEMMERFEAKINSTLQPDRTMWLYAVHDYTIANLLNSLGLFEPHFPPYASSIHIELYRTDENEHYFKMFYRKSEEEYPQALNLPGCGEKCTLKQFYDKFKDIIPGEYDKDGRPIA